MSNAKFQIRLPFRSDLSFKLIEILRDFYEGRIFMGRRFCRYVNFSEHTFNFNLYKESLDNSIIIVKNYYYTDRNTIKLNLDRLKVTPCVFTGLNVHKKFEEGFENEAFSAVTISTFLKYLYKQFSLSSSKDCVFNFNYDFSHPNYSGIGNCIHVNENVNLISYHIMMDYLGGASVESLIKEYGQEKVDEVFGKIPSIEEEILIANMFNERNEEINKYKQRRNEANRVCNEQELRYQNDRDNSFESTREEYKRKKEELQNLIEMTRQACCN